MRQSANFILLHVNTQLSQHHLLKRLFSPHWVVLVPLWKLIDTHVKVYFWIPSCIPLVCMSSVMPVPYCFGYYIFVISFKMGTFCSLFSRLFWLFRVSCIPYEFQDQLLHFGKKRPLGVLKGLHWIRRSVYGVLPF